MKEYEHQCNSRCVGDIHADISYSVLPYTTSCEEVKQCLQSWIDTYIASPSVSSQHILSVQPAPETRTFREAFPEDADSISNPEDFIYSYLVFFTWVDE